MRDKQSQTVKREQSSDATLKKTKKVKLKKDKKNLEELKDSSFFPIIIPKTLFSSTKDKKIYNRYSELVDKKLLNTLSQEEEKELAVINTTLDKLEAPVYDAIYKSLKQFLENKKSSKK